MGHFRLAAKMVPARASAGVLAGALALALFAAPAAGQQILPANFFDLVPAPAADNIALAADTLTFDQPNDRVVGTGHVGINFDGIRTTADRVVYDLVTGAVELEGNVALVDEDGVEYIADRIALDGDFRTGFVEALTVAFPDGTHFIARSTEINEGDRRIFEEALYSPCGTCIDDQGRRIGWQVRAVRVITDGTEEVTYFEAPQLELLGMPVLWLPYLTLAQGEDVEFPIFGYKEEYGARVSFPFFRYRINGGSLLLTPSLFSRQGAMLGAEWSQQVGDFSYEIEGSAIYQLDPGAFDGLADRRWRGALEAAFTFTPTNEWTFGGEGLIFSDPAYLPDYDYRSGTARNQLYAEYFTAESFLDIRTQQFVRLSEPDTWQEYERTLDRQALTFPNARGDHVAQLPDEWGRIAFSGTLLALDRRLDDGGALGSTTGYAGGRIHAMGEALWSDQYVLPGGALVTPTLGLRADAANFDGRSGRAGVPADQSRFTLTPIAALDLRYPFALSGNGATTIVEPIAQLVYRGSGESIPGITNDDSHGVALDTTNIFSFNRFSGSDRQETGLRANYGAQAETTFDNGAWINVAAGQSVQLDGQNAFAVDDGTVTGLASGLDTTHSYIVAGVAAGFSPHLTLGARAQFDPARGEVQRLLAAAESSYEFVDIGLTYAFDDGGAYNRADPALPVYGDRHEVGVEAGVTLVDYWTLSGGVAWDLAASEWLQATAGVEYNDGFLAYGVKGRVTGPTHHSPNELRVLFGFRLSTSSNDVLNLNQDFETESF